MGFLSWLINRVCLCLFVFTIISVIVKYLHSGWADPYKCRPLMTQGHWLDPPNSSHNKHSHGNWSPSTCMMHKYTANDIRHCVGERMIVFVGDSQVRQIFWATAMKLNWQQAFSDMAKARKHDDLSFKTSDNLAVHFFWDPYLNSTSLVKELTLASAKGQTFVNETRSSILVIGAGLWFAKNLNDDSLQRFNESLENTFQKLGLDEWNHGNARQFPEPLPQKDHASTLVLFAPMQRPLYASLDDSHAKNLAPARVEPLYQKMLHTWRQHEIPVLWAYESMTMNLTEYYQPDGLHVSEDVADSMADVILNVKCNSFLANSKGYPRDKTCCSKYPPRSKTQFAITHASWSSPVIAWLLPSVLPSLVAIFRGNVRGGQPPKPSNTNAHNLGSFQLLLPFDILKAGAVLSMTSSYCWLADRTHLYDKLQKHYTIEDFILLCLMTLMIGILSIRRIKAPAQHKIVSGETDKEHFFLSREQTDEWKGWMQIIILIYHYTGASKVLWIYKIVRLLVASYLFLTGYGHTIFFYTKGDFSLKRVAGVLVRLNMLSCILPYAMQTDYVFYYFAPLVSFWYLVIYATMAIGKSWNKTLLLLILKIMISATIVTTLITWRPSIFDLIFSVLSKSCNIHWDAKDWQFRLALDKYVVYIGMLVAAYTFSNKSHSAVCYSGDEDISTIVSSNLTGASLGHSSFQILGACIKNKRFLYLSMTSGGCLFYALFAYPAESKQAHNNVFPVASIGPILAFIALRNSFIWTRQFYSSSFAWIGQHSLETFVLQYHIWLAADTKGILSTGLFGTSYTGKWLNFALLTVLFLWVCWHVADAIQTLTTFIVDPRSSYQCNNLRKDHSEVQSGEISELTYPRKEDDTVSAATTTYVGGPVARFINRLKNLMAEFLWARLVLILLVFWCLNILN